jgi:hypothetical protein
LGKHDHLRAHIIALGDLLRVQNVIGQD